MLRGPLGAASGWEPGRRRYGWAGLAQALAGKGDEIPGLEIAAFCRRGDRGRRHVMCARAICRAL